MKRVHKGLRVLGLTDLEARVYLKLLEMKRARVTRLAKEVKVTRTQLYPLLEKMVEKGYVKRVEKSPAVYAVVEPEKMERMLQKWLKEQTKLVKEVQNFLKKSKKGK
ncbi:MAG: helix-turn-helix domain-containing protein [Candidatus Aenigmatarchaeota archaeon]